MVLRLQVQSRIYTGSGLVAGKETTCVTGEPGGACMRARAPSPWVVGGEGATRCHVAVWLDMTCCRQTCMSVTTTTAHDA